MIIPGLNLNSEGRHRTKQEACLLTSVPNDQPPFVFVHVHAYVYVRFEPIKIEDSRILHRIIILHSKF